MSAATFPNEWDLLFGLTPSKKFPSWKKLSNLLVHNFCFCFCFGNKEARRGINKEAIKFFRELGNPIYFIFLQYFCFGVFSFYILVKLFCRLDLFGNQWQILVGDDVEKAKGWLASKSKTALPGKLILLTIIFRPHSIWWLMITFIKSICSRISKLISY